MGKNSYRKLSISTGIKEKNLENIFSGKSKPTYLELVAIGYCLGLSPDELCNDLINNHNNRNPFYDINYKEHLEITKSPSELRDYYILSNLNQSYKCNAVFTAIIVSLYKKIGIDKTKKTVIPAIYDYLNEHYSEAFDIICNKEILNHLD